MAGRKAPRCPACGGRAVLPVCYGLPDPTLGPLVRCSHGRLVMRGPEPAVVGGCMPGPETWHCCGEGGCGLDFGQ